MPQVEELGIIEKFKQILFVLKHVLILPSSVGPFLNIRACCKALVGVCYGMESALVLVQFEQIGGTMIFPL
jgi:hypothetical protein